MKFILRFVLMVLAIGLVACANTPAPVSTAPVTVRFGYFPNITHAQAVIGIADGTFQRALGSNVTIDPKVFNAGPSVIEALFAGQIDISFIGPNPAINGYTKSNGEGVFVGYRWYEARDIEPLFPFGHGLSYTTFKQSDLRAPSTAKIGESIPVSVTVKNTGTMAGKEIVQVYVRDVQSSLARPQKELKRFAKVALKSGESQTISFTLDERAFAFYDPFQSRWVVEPGEFEILVGSSSRDIRARTTINLL